MLGIINLDPVPTFGLRKDIISVINMLDKSIANKDHSGSNIV